MTAAFTLGGGRDEALQERMQVVLRRAGELRAQALALAERELTSYAPVLGALRSGPAGPERERRVGEALSTAADVPLEIARCAAEVSELAVEALDGGNEHLRGDAVTGVLLAEAACRSARRLAELNLAGAPDDPRLSEMQALAGRAGAARGRVV